VVDLTRVAPSGEFRCRTGLIGSKLLARLHLGACRLVKFEGIGLAQNEVGISDQVNADEASQQFLNQL
jgi:hypothetical protein